MTFTNTILAGKTLVRQAIESENYVAGESGWSIKRNGDAEFNDVTARGNIEASSVDVIDPDDDTNHLVIAPNALSGIPELISYFQGEERIEVRTDGFGGAPFIRYQAGNAPTDVVSLLDMRGGGILHTWGTETKKLTYEYDPSGGPEHSLTVTSATDAQLHLQKDVTDDVTVNNIPLTTGTHARYKRTTTQSIADASVLGWQIVDIPTNVTPSPHVTRVGSGFRINTAGVYDFSAGVRFATNGAGDRHIAISNDVDETQRYASNSSPAVGQNHSLDCGSSRFFNVNDMIGVWCWQNSGGSLNLNPQGEVIHVSISRRATS